MNSKHQQWLQVTGDFIQIGRRHRRPIPSLALFPTLSHALWQAVAALVYSHTSISLQHIETMTPRSPAETKTPLK